MNKQAVAKTFGAAAASYDAAAHLQRTVADSLLSHLKHLSIESDYIVDLGTGTGYCLPWLANAYTPTQLVGLDLSESMLQAAAQREPRAQMVLADLETPPFPDNSVDLAVSSLAVQWLDEPQPFVARMTKALKPGGYLALATLGPKTLYELASAWAEVDDVPHVNRFQPAAAWLSAVRSTSLEPVCWQEQRLQVSYDTPLTLLQELKALGANFVERAPSAKIGSVRRMLKSYRRFQLPDGQYPATWDVYYLIVRKPQTS